MNSYEEKQEARRARYEEKASRLRDEAHRLHDQAHEMASAIPFGQPILVGHHSEGWDRRYRDRIHNTFGKAFATMDKADYYEEKAAKVGSGGISSDDPDALDKLNDKLETLRRRHEFMKAANAAIHIIFFIFNPFKSLLGEIKLDVTMLRRPSQIEAAGELTGLGPGT